MRVTQWREPGRRARHTARARAVFEALRTPAEVRQRVAAIATLERHDWKGTPVFRLTCQAEFGRGPHDQFVPEAVLWALIDLGWWRCPFHRP